MNPVHMRRFSLNPLLKSLPAIPTHKTTHRLDPHLQRLQLIPAITLDKSLRDMDAATVLAHALQRQLGWDGVDERRGRRSFERFAFGLFLLLGALDNVVVADWDAGLARVDDAREDGVGVGGRAGEPVGGGVAGADGG